MPYKINPFTGNPDYYDASTGGTVTSITAGNGLSGGTITTSGTIDIDGTKVPYYALGPSAGLVQWNGSAWVIDATNYVNKAGDTMTGFLTLNADPSSPLHAATKQYVDNLATGINFHAPVVAATAASLPLVTYSNGIGGVGATLIATAPGALTIDTIAFLGGGTERVLIKDQVSGLENGIYVVSIAGDISTPFQLTRATDADNSPSGELAFGDFCFVEQGPTNGGFGYILNTTGTITVGTTALSYVIFNAAQVVTAGTGLTEVPTNTLNIDTLKVPYYSGGFVSTGLAKWDGANWVFDNSTYLDTTTAASTYLTITNAASTYYLQTNPAGYITNAALIGFYVPYTGATNNVDLGAFQLTTSQLNISSVTTGSVLFAGVSGALSQDNANFFWDDANNRLGIGTSTPTHSLDISGTTKISGNTIWLNQASPSGANYTIKTDALKTEINDVTRLNLNINANTNIQIDPSLIAFSTVNSAGAVNQDFTFVSGSKVSSPSGVAFPSFKYTPGSRQWVAGTIANQQEVQILSPLYGFTSASTITNAYSLYVNAPTAGTNATITNNYALGVKGQVGLEWTSGGATMIIGDWGAFSTYGWGIITSNNLFRLPTTLYIGDTNFSIKRASTTGIIEPFNNITLQSGNTAGGQKTYLAGIQSTGHVGIGTLTPTERLEVNGTTKITNGGLQVQGGLSSPTGAGFELEYTSGIAYVTSYNRTTSSWLPIQIRGSSISLNNQLTTIATIDGSGITIADNYNIVLGSSIGTKIGTATTQKLGFFNATPIVQPAAVNTLQGLATALGNLGLVASSPNVSVWNVTTQTGATYSAANGDYVLINAATQTVTLPAAVANARVGVKMINATVTNIQVRTASAGVTIDGVDRSSTGLGLFNQYDAYVFVSDGTNWYIES